MRYTTYAMIIALVVACCATSAMAAGSWLWPFGGQSADEASTTTPTVPEQSKEERSQTSQTAKASRPALAQPFSGRYLPRPKLPSLWPSKSEAGQVRNAWAKPSTEPEKASPWQVVTDGARRINTSTRNAWNKTVDVLNPFDNKDSSVAQHQSRPSFWSNMFRVEDETPKGPSTVTEWMAQQRLDP
jgi:hypothetical protein